MFLDASAIVAILLKETDWESLASKVDPDRQNITSALSRYEAVLGVVRSRLCEIEAANILVGQFLDQAKVSIISIDDPIGVEALAAFSRFGRGRHKAALNMGDCFAYACAKSRKMPLLFKGNDFIHTDIRIA
jgi:ribonuclease VapC